MYSRFPTVIGGEEKMIETSGKYLTINGRPAHRVIMELHIGRKLSRLEVVHHINGDKSDNRIENLEIMLLKDHSKMHMYEGRKLPETTVEKLVEHGRNKRPGATNDVEMVKRIKEMIAHGQSNISIANQLGKSRFYISKIKRGQNWSWIDKPTTKNNRSK